MIKEYRGSMVIQDQEDSTLNEMADIVSGAVNLLRSREETDLDETDLTTLEWGLKGVSDTLENAQIVFTDEFEMEVEEPAEEPEDEDSIENDIEIESSKGSLIILATLLIGTVGITAYSLYSNPNRFTRKMKKELRSAEIQAEKLRGLIPVDEWDKDKALQEAYKEMKIRIKWARDRNTFEQAYETIVRFKQLSRI